MPAQIKALIDRCYSLVTNYHKPGHTSLMEGKRIGLLVTGADVYEENAEGLFTAFNRFAGFLLARKSGELYVGECSVPAELSEAFGRLIYFFVDLAIKFIRFCHSRSLAFVRAVLRYSSHSIGSNCFLAVLHVLQHGTTFPLVLFPPREIGTI